MLTLITPTGGRPAAFALCERWMSRQWLKWDQWIVVDDCEPRTICSLGQEVIRPEPLWKPGDNTQARNMQLALEAVRGDIVLVIEDDDYYAPDYLMTMADKLQMYEAVGEVPAIYYNLQARAWRSFENRDHASLCQTGFRISAMRQMMEAVVDKEQFIDLNFWNRVYRDGVGANRFEAPMPLSVGIKGLPGRPGIGCGHRSNLKRFEYDPEFVKLRALIGKDAEIYIERSEEW